MAEKKKKAPAKKTAKPTKKTTKTTVKKTHKSTKKVPAVAKVKPVADYIDPQNMTDTLEESMDSASIAKKSGLKVNRTYLMITAILAGLALLAYMFRSEFVVAYVNGEPITRLTLIQELEKYHRDDTLDAIVTRMLIAQKANEEGVTVTDEDVNAEIETIKANVVAQGQDFDALLEMQGISMDSLLEDIKLQLLLDQLAGGNDPVSEEDIDSYVEANTEYFPEEMEETDRRDAAKEQLEGRNSQVAVQTFLNELKGSADIEYTK